MATRLTPETAEILGLQALAWLVGDPDRLERFLAVSGADGDSLRQGAERPDLQGSILEFLLAHEDLLLAFCDDVSARPAEIHAARRLLEGG